ncbi:hypothetical protein D0B54_12995 [Solimonas sp. K1W22B-7]|nr:hypothetical protein D0B54_12995 [Solimonas sp. K1W22B-7]
MSFVGLTEQGWSAYLVRGDGKARAVPGLGEVRQLSWAPANHRLVYMNLEGAVLELRGEQKGPGTLLVPADDPDGYTQLRLSPDGEALWAVRLVQRQSERTQLVRYDTGKRRFVLWHEQRGTLFDVMPLASGEVLYTQVSCVVDCGGIRQELWNRSAAGEARQVSLLNGTLRYPVRSGAGALWFSFGTGDSGFGLWRWPTGGNPRAITTTGESDLWPSAVGEEIYFVRRNANGGRLMRWRQERVEEIPLPGVQDVRDLEVNP